MPIRPLLFALPLLLTACGGEAPVENLASANEAAPVLAEGPKLAGIDLFKRVRAGGKAPFWTLDVAPGSVTFADRAGADPVDFYPADPAVTAESATWTTKDQAGQAVTIVLRAMPCDGAPLTAEVAIGTRRLRGCASQAQAR